MFSLEDLTGWLFTCPSKLSIYRMQHRCRFAGEDFDLESYVVEKCSKPPALTLQCAMRTIFNCWPCSGNLNIETHTCVFGCSDQPDRYSHYESCPRLQQAFVSEFGRFVPSCFLRHPWGVGDDSAPIQIAAIAYSSYCTAARFFREGTSFNLEAAVRSASLLHPFSKTCGGTSSRVPVGQAGHRVSLASSSRVGGASSSRDHVGQSGHSTSHTLPATLAEAIAASKRLHSSGRRRRR